MPEPKFPGPLQLLIRLYYSDQALWARHIGREEFLFTVLLDRWGSKYRVGVIEPDHTLPIDVEMPILIRAIRERIESETGGECTRFGPDIFMKSDVGPIPSTSMGGL